MVTTLSSPTTMSERSVLTIVFIVVGFRFGSIQAYYLLRRMVCSKVVSVAGYYGVMKENNSLFIF